MFHFLLFNEADPPTAAAAAGPSTTRRQTGADTPLGMMGMQHPPAEPQFSYNHYTHNSYD